MQQGTNVDLAVAQVTAVSQTLLRTMPPGIFPPLIVQTDASSVPILQLGLSSGTLTGQQLYDYGQNFIRTRLATIPGREYLIRLNSSPELISAMNDIPIKKVNGTDGRRRTGAAGRSQTPSICRLCRAGFRPAVELAPDKMPSALSLQESFVPAILNRCGWVGRTPGGRE